MDPKLSDKDRSSKMEELRRLVAAAESAEERESREAGTVAERRAEYDVRDPRLPAPWVEQYNEDFIGWESPLYDVAHEHGLAGEQVRGLRDAAVELGQVVGDTGKPLDEAELTRVFDRYGVSAFARPALVKLWRQIEGGGGVA